MQKTGEICNTTYRDGTHWAKLTHQGTPGIWVGYTEGHPTNTYWGFNPETKKIILTSDITFLQMAYDEYCKVEKPVLVIMSYEKLDDEKELKIVPMIYNNSSSNLVTDSNRMKRFLTKVVCAMKNYKLHTMTMPTKLSSKL